MHTSCLSCLKKIAQDERLPPCTFDHFCGFGYVSVGFKLKRQATGKCEDFGSYTYALSPLTMAPRSLDWKIVAFSGAGIVCEHIYCHEVKPDDDLDELISECHSSHAVAVILLNCDESYSLPKTVRSTFTKTDYPVLVLAAEDGRKLLKTLKEEDEDGDFLARVLEKEPLQESPKQELKSKHGECLYPFSFQNCTCVLHNYVVTTYGIFLFSLSKLDSS